MTRGNVWIIDDDPSIRWVLTRALKKAGMEPRGFEAGNDALHRFKKNNSRDDKPDLIITDIRMPGISGLELLDSLQAMAPDIPVVIMTAHSDLDSAVASYRSGAFEYLPKPFDLNEAVALAERAMQQPEPANDSAQAQFPELLGSAPAMQNVFRAIGRLSRSHINVLIRGESGTGKELVAQALHGNSPRAQRPFVAINTAAIPSELLESELFGHERGAFTGAQSQRKGRFEQAHTGTLFLDEIGDMPIALQTRLLRVLSEGRFYRVGGHEQIEVDVRIIAATHQNLETLVEQGKFREDLFHRLNVMQVTLPPLRDRREDIETLAKQFLQEAAQELNVETKTLVPQVSERFQNYHWPGNVRELQNTCRRLTVMAPSQTITLDDLPDELHGDISDETNTSWQTQLKQVARQQLERGDTDILTNLNAQFEKLLIEQALAHTGGHKQEAAKKLGLGRNTLTRKLKEFESRG